MWDFVIFMATIVGFIVVLMLVDAFITWLNK